MPVSFSVHEAVLSSITSITGITALNESFTLFITGITDKAILRSNSFHGVKNFSPILERAAFMFDIAPVNVLFASLACSPKA